MRFSFGNNMLRRPYAARVPPTQGDCGLCEYAELRGLAREPLINGLHEVGGPSRERKQDCGGPENQAVRMDFLGNEASVGVSPAFSGPLPFSGRTLAVERQQPPLGDDQVREREEQMQLRGVLRQAPVAYLAIAKEVIDDVKRMFKL